MIAQNVTETPPLPLDKDGNVDANALTAQLVAEDVARKAEATKLSADDLRLDPQAKQKCEMYLQENLGKYTKLLETCSKRQAVRIAQSLAITPFNKEPFHFSYTHEKEIYELGNNIQNAKLILLMLLEKEVPASAGTTKPDEKQGESNAKN